MTGSGTGECCTQIEHRVGRGDRIGPLREAEALERRLEVRIGDDVAASLEVNDHAVDRTGRRHFGRRWCLDGFGHGGFGHVGLGVVGLGVLRLDGRDGPGVVTGLRHHETDAPTRSTRSATRPPTSEPALLLLSAVGRLARSATERRTTRRRSCRPTVLWARSLTGRESCSGPGCTGEWTPGPRLCRRVRRRRLLARTARARSADRPGRRPRSDRRAARWVRRAGSTGRSTVERSSRRSVGRSAR